jgi:hypothetical protein
MRTTTTFGFRAEDPLGVEVQAKAVKPARPTHRAPRLEAGVQNSRTTVLIARPPSACGSFGFSAPDGGAKLDYFA